MENADLARGVHGQQGAAVRPGWMLSFGVLGLAGFLVSGAEIVRPPTSAGQDPLARAKELSARGLMKQAIEVAGEAIAQDPRNPAPLILRAQLHDRTRQPDLAEADLTRAIELSPHDPGLFYARGMLRLRLGLFEGAVADFDKVAAARPSRAADLWQRGIGLFYVGRFADAARQFEEHRRVNPSDVENSAWHFASVARAESVKAAREKWMPVTGDPRIPMEEVQALFTGKGTAEDVLRAAEKADGAEASQTAKMYAHLYLSLYHVAHGDRTAAARHAGEASQAAPQYGIMSDIARVHANWVAERLRGGGF